MSSAINLGSFVTVNGKTVSSGIGSGLDTQALIKSLTDIKEQPAVDLGKTKDTNTSKISALGELRAKLSVFQTALSSLRDAGISSSSVDVFTQRQGFVTSNDGVSGSTYLGIAAGAGADITSYDITIDHLAKNKIQRTNAFTSATASVTDAAGMAGANRFQAGTFQISGGGVTNEITTPSGFTLTAAAITTTGTTGTAALDNTYGTGGINTIAVTGTGDYGLVGSLSGAEVSSTQDSLGSDITLNVSINGKTYTGTITANTGAGSDEIAAGTVITLTNSDTGTSFNVKTGPAIEIATNSDLSAFSSNIYSDLSGITFKQSREVSAFDEDKVALTTLSGLSSTNVLLNSDNYNPYTGSHGNISNFIVTGVSAPGASDATITVTIDGEDYTATGLGGGVGDTQTANITLTSASGRTFSLNIGDAAISLDLSTTTKAKTIQKDLNTVFSTGTNITLAQGDSLNTIAGKINSTSTTSGVSATVLKVADGDYRLTLQSTKTGVVNAYTIDDVVSNSLTNVTFNPVQSAVDAEFFINGADITRPLNAIDDVINNVTFNLFQATPPATDLTVDVTNNGQAVKDAVTNFITAYNDLKTFAAVQQEQNSDGTYVDTALLGDSNVLNNVLTNVQTQLNTIVSGLSSSSLKSLADIGITFTDKDADTTNKIPQVNNILAMDDTKFISALTTNFDDIKSIFDFNFNSSSNDKLRVFSRTNALTANKFDVDVDTTRPVGEQVKFLYTDSSGVSQSVYADFTANSSGGLIEGVTGTPFEGLQLLYVGNGQDLITDNTATQGIADKLFNIVDPLLADKGNVDQEVQNLNDANTQIDKDVATIEDQVSTYRDQLTDKYSALNAAIQKANNILLFLDAMNAARTGNSNG